MKTFAKKQKNKKKQNKKKKTLEEEFRPVGKYLLKAIEQRSWTLF